MTHQSIELGQLQVGEKAHIASYGSISLPYRHQLMAMGLTRGTSFTVTGIAPLGCPVKISVRGFDLCLRKDEARGLVITRENA